MGISEGKRGTGKRRRARVVLVVEDDDAVRDEVCAALQSAGYAVLQATDGEEALGVLLSNDKPEPTVIVLDMWLPRMTGQELLQVVQGYHRLAKIPIVISSASHLFEHYAEARHAGWLPKPYDADALLSAVNVRCEPEVASSPASSA